MDELKSLGYYDAIRSDLSQQVIQKVGLDSVQPQSFVLSRSQGTASDTNLHRDTGLRVLYSSPSKLSLNFITPEQSYASEKKFDKSIFSKKSINKAVSQESIYSHTQSKEKAQKFNSLSHFANTSKKKVKRKQFPPLDSVSHESDEEIDQAFYGKHSERKVSISPPKKKNYLSSLPKIAPITNSDRVWQYDRFANCRLLPSASGVRTVDPVQNKDPSPFRLIPTARGWVVTHSPF